MRIEALKFKTDAKNCFVLLIASAIGLILFSIAPSASAQTNPLIYRIQLRLETATVEGADFSGRGGIYVKLNDESTTWLNYSHDDFKKRDVFLYDILLDDIRNLNDIEYFIIGNNDSDDGLCLSRIELYVNRGLLYREERSDSRCQWIKSQSEHPREHFIPRSAFDLSLPGNGPALNTMNAENMTQAIEAAVGNSIHGTALRWKDGVRLSTPSGDTLRVTVPLEYRGGNDPDATLRFNLVISCNDNQNVRIIIRDWSIERGFAIGIGFLDDTSQPPQLMKDVRRYMRQLLNRRVDSCNRENLILVTNGPEIRITG